MMNAIGTKLSKHVLGMKFMRKTKAQVDKDKTEQTFRKHYSAAPSKVQEDLKSKLPSDAATSKTTTTVTCIVEEVNSYSQCEGHIFGRQSFGGFNPTLEENIRKGIWRPFYLDPAINPEGAGEDENLNEDSEDDEKDVTDEQMAKKYGSLVGSLGKRFMKKKDRNGAGETDSSEQPPKSKKLKMDTDGEQGNKKRGKWANMFKGAKGKWKNNKKGNEGQQQETSGHDNSNRKGGMKRPQNSPPAAKTPPPNKKRKFMKPSDD